jgi:hypothetical protein
VTAAALRDIQARIVRALEAFRDGDYELAEFILDDLAGDLWRLIEELEAA